MKIKQISNGAEYEAKLIKIDDESNSCILSYKDAEGHFYCIDCYRWVKEYELVKSTIDEDMMLMDNEYKLTREKVNKINNITLPDLNFKFKTPKRL